MIDPLHAAEYEWARYEREVLALLAEEWEHMRAAGGGWGDRAALLGELTKMADSFRIAPPAEWARKLVRDTR